MTDAQIFAFCGGVITVVFFALLCTIAIVLIRNLD